eukprot:TRINITY_DN3495_c0_g1_i18.p1 TRINITY_DN3495_c0_g1~~TRINITY_DN3495_c0_g1_i18.p1  ORF type:complete len:239 (+),score=43.93 TRINITY_DN3495_c0_g1_i18:78-794(+)
MCIRDRYMGDYLDRAYQKYKKSGHKRSHAHQSPKKLLEGYFVNLIRQKKHSERGFNSNYFSSFRPAKQRTNERTGSDLLMTEKSIRRTSNFSSKFPLSGRSKSRSHSQKKYQQILNELKNPLPSFRGAFTSRQDNLLNIFSNFSHVNPLTQYKYGRKRSGLERANKETSELVNAFAKRGSAGSYRKKLMRVEAKKLLLYMETMSDKDFAELPLSYREELARLAQAVMSHRNSTLALFK